MSDQAGGDGQDVEHREGKPPVVYIRKARCPRCNSVKHYTQRSTQQGDGSVMRHVLCRECGRRFMLVVE